MTLYTLLWTSLWLLVLYTVYTKSNNDSQQHSPTPHASEKGLRDCVHHRRARQARPAPSCLSMRPLAEPGQEAWSRARPKAWPRLGPRRGARPGPSQTQARPSLPDFGIQQIENQNLRSDQKNDQVQINRKKPPIPIWGIRPIFPWTGKMQNCIFVCLFSLVVQ